MIFGKPKIPGFWSNLGKKLVKMNKGKPKIGEKTAKNNKGKPKIGQK